MGDYISQFALRQWQEVALYFPRVLHFPASSLFLTGSGPKDSVSHHSLKPWTGSRSQRDRKWASHRQEVALLAPPLSSPHDLTSWPA